ncbi:hypothetical protein [Brevundimonas sp. Root1423]|uniref:hypothetical protein n=1 Tax=Brevundimonas sp. Root1423 TaxID=1736462 RepID=UPI0006F295B3|nr:hypothetical protein [Brevundimonas sp. Root1423]KQY75093.1 hypothetical protein ASD25_10905 [Brevundimonas sp. Root1423]
MARFSIGTAINDAFGLIGRRPLSVFVWGLILVVPSAAALVLILPMMGDMVVAMELQPADGAAHEAAFAEMMQFQAMSGLFNIIQLLLIVVVYTAIMRAVLRPAESRFFSLRLGMDELRTAVVGLALIVGIYAAMIILVLIGGAIGFAVWGAGSPMNWLVIAGLVVTAFVAVFIALARVSLIMPASVLYRTFAFTEGWRLGRGQTGSLFGMMLLLFLVLMVIQFVVYGIGFSMVVGAGMSGGFDWASLRSDSVEANPFEGLTAMFAANWPWFAVGSLVVAMIYGAMVTLHVVPYASACRQLAGSGAPSPVDEPAPVA